VLEAVRLQPTAKVANGCLARLEIIGGSSRVALPAPHGVTRPCTPPGRCSRSLTSSACSRRLASGTRLASPRMAARTNEGEKVQLRELVKKQIP
jgi:hypothetical protein